MSKLLSIMLWLFALSIASSTRCSRTDAIIYQKKGHTFPTVFRSFGGLYTSKASYEEKIVQFMHLSPSCASCYGDAYICGYERCKWKCIRAGEACDKCLTRRGCIDQTQRCTGFY